MLSELMDRDLHFPKKFGDFAEPLVMLSIMRNKAIFAGKLKNKYTSCGIVL